MTRCARFQLMKTKPFIDRHALLKQHMRVKEQLLPDDHVYYEMSDRLLERLEIIRIAPKNILIIDWHPHQIKNKLNDRYPDATVQSAHDAICVAQYADESFDLIIAHFALLREREPMHLLQEMYRVLRDKGLLMLTSLGPDTFFELNNSFLTVDQFFHVHPFVDMHDVGDWMRQLHFVDPVMDREEIVLAYDQLELLFDDIKAVGAANVHEARRRSLFSPKQWQQMMAHYHTLKTEDYYPATLEVIYGHAWRDNSGKPKRDEVAISIDKITHKKKR
jgi:malonyl-CoA O-methyltransferase